MAVVTLYMSDRDKTGKTFVSKKDADEHDKKLELAENLSVFLGHRLTFLNEKQVEEIGFMLAEHRDLLAQALKGKPELLLDAEPGVTRNTAEEPDTADTSAQAEMRAIAEASEASSEDQAPADTQSADKQAADKQATEKKVRAIGR